MKHRVVLLSRPRRQIDKMLRWLADRVDPEPVDYRAGGTD